MRCAYALPNILGSIFEPSFVLAFQRCLMTVCSGCMSPGKILPKHLHSGRRRVLGVLEEKYANPIAGVSQRSAQEWILMSGHSSPLPTGNNGTRYGLR